MKVRLSPTDSASNRTKNRIREHGPVFFRSKQGNPHCFDGHPCLLVVAADQWFGWLPENEIIVETVEE